MHAQSIRRRSRFGTAMLFAAAVAGTGVSNYVHGQTVASWIGGLFGSWPESAKWSSNPFYPNNGNPTGATYDVFINAPPNALVDLNSAVTINSITMDSSAHLWLGTAARLDARTITINSGSLSTLAGAEIYNATLRTSGAGRFQFLESVLSACTIGNSMSAEQFYVRNGLNLQNASLSATLFVDGSQAFGGTGTLASVIYVPSGTATFGSGLTLISSTIGGNGNFVSPGSWINQGTILVDKDVQLTATWKNEGTINLNAGQLILNGSFTSSGIGKVVRTGGTIVLSGRMDNTGSVFAPDQLGSPLRMRAFYSNNKPTITGGTLLMSPTTPLTIDNGARFDGVTVAGEWVLTSQPRINNLTIAAGGQLRLKTLNRLGLDFPSGPQQINGGGTLLLDGGTIQTSNGPLTIGPELTVTGSGAINGQASFTNLGTISAQQNYISISGAVNNLGILKANDNGVLSLWDISPGRLGSFDSTGGRVQIDGTLDNTGNLFVLNGTANTLYINGTLTGGTVQTTNGAELHCSALVSGARLDADLILYGDSTFTNGTSMALGRKVHMVAPSRLAIDSSFAGEILLEYTNTFGSSVGGTTNQTISLGTVVRTNGGNGTFGGGSSTYTTEFYGLLSAESPATTLGIAGASQTFNNHGVLIVSDGTLSNTAKLNNFASITIAGGTLALGGTWNNSSGSITLSSGRLNLGGNVDATKFGTFARTGGSVALTGTFNNTASTADITNTFGPWLTAGNATIVGGTIVPPIPGQSLEVTTAGLTISGSTINTNIDVAPGAYLAMAGSWHNNGIIAASGATIQLGGTFTPADVGTISTDDLYITGTLNNAGNTMVLDASPPKIHVDGGHIVGGSIDGVGAGTLFAGAGGVLSSLTLNGQLQLQPSLSIVTTFQLQNVVNNGTVKLPALINLSTGSSVNNGTTIVSGGTLRLDGAWANPGTIHLDGGELIIPLNSGTAGNSGTISGNGTLLITGDGTMADLGHVERTGGTFQIGGILNNTGNTLHIDDVGTWALTGTIKGGTIASNSSTAALALYGEYPGLEGVTVTGHVKAVHSTYLIKQLQLANGSFTLTDGSSMTCVGSETVTGTGDIFLTKSTIAPYYSTLLTIGPGIAVRTLNEGGSIGWFGSFVNQGLISAETPNRGIAITGTFTNNGTIQVTAGTLSLATTSLFPSYLQGSLTSGVWIVGSNSTLTLDSATITTNDATVTLNGVGSTFAAIDSLRRNRKAFSITNGRNFSSVGSLTNSGTINIGSLSTLTVLDRIDNTAGLIDLNCKMIVDYSTVSPLSELVGQIGTQIISSAANVDPSLGIGSKDDGNVVLLQLTKLGDANLDGAVNYTDLAALSQNYSESSLVGPGWTGGDFNYDGSVNLTDLYALGYQYNDPLNPLPQALESLGLPVIEVPEPGMMLLFAGMLGGTLRPRKRTWDLMERSQF